MAERQDGGPAFPHMVRNRPDLGENVEQRLTDGGMSLRDWFAGQALCIPRTGNPVDASNEAKFAYGVADAMLAERAKGE